MNRRKLPSLLGATLCLVLAVPPVRANEQADGVTYDAAATADTADSAAEARKQQAVGLLVRARVHYANGDFDAAIVLLERAYELTGSSRYVFNLGAAHHGAGHCEIARSYYEEYLRREPRGSERGAAAAALEEIYSKCGRAHVRDHRYQVAGSLLSGVGAAAGIAALTSLTMMQKTRSDLDDRAAAGGLWNPAEAASLTKNGDRYETLSQVFGVSSLVLLAAGATLLVLDSRRDASVSVMVGSFSGVRYQQAF
jgi:tetratricopeptide (TPR) repeat protein